MPEIGVMLTPDEVRALRMALIFGQPDEPHDTLESAKRKLNEAEASIEALGMNQERSR